MAPARDARAQQPTAGPAVSMSDSAAAEKVCTSVTESLRTLANEPSVGLYYVVEHIQLGCTAADKAAQPSSNHPASADLDAGYARRHAAGDAWRHAERARQRRENGSPGSGRCRRESQDGGA